MGLIIKFTRILEERTGKGGKNMADAKTIYSNNAREYINKEVVLNEKDYYRYKASKEREKRYNSIWEQNKVNINEIVLKYQATIRTYTEGGVKFIYEGERYIIKADKVAGYLRIYDKVAHSFLTTDGQPSRCQDLTHFKIKKSEEMV